MEKYMSYVDLFVIGVGLDTYIIVTYTQYTQTYIRTCDTLFGIVWSNVQLSSYMLKVSIVLCIPLLKTRLKYHRDVSI